MLQCQVTACGQPDSLRSSDAALPKCPLKSDVANVLMSSKTLNAKRLDVVPEI